MRIVLLSTEALTAIEGKEFVETPENKNPKHAAYVAAAEQIKSELNTPTYLSSATKVTYNEKFDRYVVTFSSREKIMSLKATNAVAEFVTAHITEHGSWQGRMEDGELVEVNLVQA